MFVLSFLLHEFSFLQEDIEYNKSPLEYRTSFLEKPAILTRNEYELLYIETLYTIKHKIGTTTSKYIQGESDLVAYAQEAFGLSNEDHQRLLEKANEEKVVHLSLSKTINRLFYLATYSYSQCRSRRSERSRSKRCQW